MQDRGEVDGASDQDFHDEATDQIKAMSFSLVAAAGCRVQECEEEKVDAVQIEAATEGKVEPEGHV